MACFSTHYKLAIVDSNFALGAATWRTRRNNAVLDCVSHGPHYVKT